MTKSKKASGIVTGLTVVAASIWGILSDGGIQDQRLPDECIVAVVAEETQNTVNLFFGMSFEIVTGHINGQNVRYFAIPKEALEYVDMKELYRERMKTSGISLTDEALEKSFKTLGIPAGSLVLQWDLEKIEVYGVPLLATASYDPSRFIVKE